MIPLYARLSARQDRDPFIARITTDVGLPFSQRSTEALLLDRNPGIEGRGFQSVFLREGVPTRPGWFTLPPELGYLGDGDIVRVNPRGGEVRVLFRRSGRNISFLLTERCNSRCLMCSQPPREADDSYLISELLQALPLVPPDTEAIGFTGGEPTLLGDGFLRLLECSRDHLPQTHLSVLTNGRLFSYLKLAQRVAAVEHPSLVLCVPLYSEIDALHDFVVQAQGAFDQTVRGLLNLGRVGVLVEVRVVIHRQTYQRLPQLAEFIVRNLPFVHHVALMGLEVTGFAKPNLDALWIEPVEYQQELAAAVEVLDGSRIETSIYNHPLCLLDRQLWPFARKSISDWKEVYLPVCAECSVREQCGGLFGTSGQRVSAQIHAL